MRRIVFFLRSLSFSAGAFGAGFGLYEMDAKSTAFGGNVVGKPFGPSTIYYNPAGRTRMTVEPPNLK